MKIGDRVICVKAYLFVPVGMTGTILNIHHTDVAVSWDDKNCNILINKKRIEVLPPNSVKFIRSL